MSKTRRSLLMLLALSVLHRPLSALLSVLLPDLAVNPIPQCAAGMLLSVLLLGLPAWGLRPWTSDRLPKGKTVLPGMLLAVIAVILTRASMDAADAVWQGWLNVMPDAMPVPESIPVAMLYVISMAVVPALMEESFFRGAVLTSLLDGGRRWTAVLLSTVSFALMHGSLANLPSLLVLSLLLTLLMLHTGRICVPMAAHFVYNLTALGRPEIPGWGSALCAAGLLAMTVYLCIRQPGFAHLPMKRQDRLIAAAAVLALAAAYIV